GLAGFPGRIAGEPAGVPASGATATAARTRFAHRVTGNPEWLAWTERTGVTYSGDVSREPGDGGVGAALSEITAVDRRDGSREGGVANSSRPAVTPPFRPGGEGEAIGSAGAARQGETSCILARWGRGVRGDPTSRGSCQLGRTRLCLQDHTLIHLSEFRRWLLTERNICSCNDMLWLHMPPLGRDH